MIKRRYDKSREAIRPLRIEVPCDSFPERGKKTDNSIEWNRFYLINRLEWQRLNLFSESGLNVTPSSTSSLASSASSLGTFCLSYPINGLFNLPFFKQMMPSNPGGSHLRWLFQYLVTCQLQFQPTRALRQKLEFRTTMRSNFEPNLACK